MKLLLTKRFQRSFEKLPKSIQLRVKKALLELHHNPYVGKKLTGDLQGEYSYRVGKYRIIYTLLNGDIYAETVRHRKEVYHR